MSERTKATTIEGAGFVERIDFRRSRSGRRLWSTEQKGRIVRESLAPGARVADVARTKCGLRSQQLTHWRRAARSGRLALVTDEPAEFVEIALEDLAVHKKTEAKIEIVVGKVLLRLERDVASTRIAEIVTALERDA
jgi:transposase